MKKNKILLTSLAATFLILGGSLVSCGDNNNGGDDSGGGNPQDPVKEITSLTIRPEYKHVDMAVGDYIFVDQELYEILPSGLPAKQRRVEVTILEGEDVVSYEDQLLTAIGAGEATIEVSSEVKPELKDTFTVSAVNPVFDRNMSTTSFFDMTYETDPENPRVTSPDESTGDLIFANVSSTKWYAESTIKPISVASTEYYPKFGITSNSLGTDADTANSSFYYFLNAYIGEGDTPNYNWTDVGFCEVRGAVGWAWNPGITNGDARHNDGFYQNPEPLTLNDSFKMGMARDGIRYYFWFNDTYIGCFDILQDLIPADVPSAPGLFEFNSNVEFSKYSATADEAVVDEKIASIGEDIKLITTVADD